MFDMHFKHFTEPGDEIGKLFIGGLSWETTYDSLLQYFGQFGELVDCVVMRNSQTGQSRGFGFVKFKEEKCVEKVLNSGPHILDGRQIDPKICNPRHLNQGGKSATNYGKKVFLGGLPAEVTTADLTEVFLQYGKVVEVVIMYDHQKRKSRGFGFLTYEAEESVDKVCSERFISVCGRQVECKKAEPRDSEQLGSPGKGMIVSTNCGSPISKGSPINWMVGAGAVTSNGLVNPQAVASMTTMPYAKPLPHPLHIPAIMTCETSGVAGETSPSITTQNMMSAMVAASGADGKAYSPTSIPHSPMFSPMSPSASSPGSMHLQHAYSNLQSPLVAGGASHGMPTSPCMATASPIHCYTSSPSNGVAEHSEAIGGAEVPGAHSVGLLGGMVPFLITVGGDGSHNGLSDIIPTFPVLNSMYGGGHMYNNGLLHSSMMNGHAGAAGDCMTNGAAAFIRGAPLTIQSFHPYRRK